MDETTYSDRKATKILREAMERQLAAHTEGEGHTVADLERIADELGIDRQYLHDALHDDGVKADAQTQVLGAPEQDHQVEWLDGQLTSEGWSRAVFALNDRFRTAVSGTFDGTRGEWVGGKNGAIRVLAQQVGGRIRLEIMRDVDGNNVFGLLLGMVAAMGFSMLIWAGLSLPGQAKLVLWLVALVTTWLGMRASLGKVYRGEQAVTANVLSLLARKLTDASVIPASSPGLGESSPALVQNADENHLTTNR